MIFCTIAGREQASGALVLAKSIKRHHPESRILLCLVEHHLPASCTTNVDQVLTLTNHGFPIESMESLSAAKAYLLRHLVEASEPGAPSEGESIIYLDPDTKLYSRIDDINNWTDHYPIVAVPYRLEPECSERDSREIDRLRDGFLHSGFLAIRRCDAARQFIRWWLMHIEQDLYGGRDPKAADKWLSLGMIWYRLGILRNPAYHAASWNVDESRRQLDHSDSGFLKIQGEPLRIFCFSNPNGLLDESRSNPVIDMLVREYEEERRRVFLDNE